MAVVSATPAFAVPGYTFTKMFGKEVNTSTASTCLATELANCKTGVTGAEPGQFNTPRGIAVDPATVAGVAGDIYVADSGNFRVQKLGPAGEFILMFGREVNETKVAEFNEAGNPHKITAAEENLCTQAEVSGGAKCKIGVVSAARAQLPSRNRTRSRSIARPPVL